MDTTSILQIAAILLALGMLWPLWLLIQRIIFGRRNWLRIILALLYTLVMVPIGLAITFGLSYGQTVSELDLLTDLVLFGMLPLGILTLLCYVLDHVLDWPHGILLAAAACLSLTVLPLGYVFTLANPELLKDNWEITLEQENAVEESKMQEITEPAVQEPKKTSEDANAGEPGLQLNTGSVEGNLNQPAD